ncbi:hypothetical protein [Nocardia phage NBR1]|uniref:hypothetical protein n=1 Tax=Nocardia phage NBR1 TaxID=1109711 RepID=UPI00023EEDFE|nr:hypothetical protein NoPhNBR1_gp59 [Nocardia phage NBR1]AEV52272.1 hypothetical protein [Nocardia phage NBR1]
MNAPSPNIDRSGVLLADRVPWLFKGATAYIIDTAPDSPMALPVTVVSIDARVVRTSSSRWPRFLQARAQNAPYGSDHWGYSHFTELGVALVGPDNPHVARIEEHREKAETWRGIQRGWQQLTAARRRSPADMHTAALALRDVLNTYLEGSKTE